MIDVAQQHFSQQQLYFTLSDTAPPAGRCHLKLKNLTRFLSNRRGPDSIVKLFSREVSGELSPITWLEEEEEPPALHSIRHNPAQVRIECRGTATCQEP